MPVPENFIHQVSSVLNHLYDPDVLRVHPLVATFGLSSRNSPHVALREIFIQEVERLKPDISVPMESRSWRVYKILQSRYINQLDQDQTAFQLGIGVRHLRREQRIAVEVLADALYQKFSSQINSPLPLSQNVLSVESEFSRIKTSEPDNSAVLTDILPSSLSIVTPLAVKKGIALELCPLPELPPIALLPAALRQLIVSMTSCAIGRLQQGKIVFAGYQENKRIKLVLEGESSQNLLPGSDSFAAGIITLRTILGEAGELFVTESTQKLSIVMVLPIVEIVRVLIVDDNFDVVQLFKRYLFGTCYKIEAVQSGNEVFDKVSRYSADVILLDVMMPGVDGWEILGRLKNHPLTAHIPIIVCTVLPEKDLALALGANDYLSKPASRENLLLILNRVLFRER